MRQVLPVLFILIAVARASAQPLSFTSETVDDTAYSATIVLKISDQNLPHLLFTGAVDAYGAGLHYMVRSGGQWTMVRSFAGGNSSLALDHEGRPHISYANTRSGGIPDSLQYVTLDDSGWRYETIDLLVIWYFNSIAVDSQDEPHVVYRKVSNFGYPNESDLVYRRREAGAWTLGWSVFGAPRSPSLAMDPGDDPCVIVAVNNGSLTPPTRYYHMVNGVVTGEDIGPKSYSGLISKLSIDSAGHSHVAFFEGQSMDVWYGTRNDAGWSFGTVAARDQAGNVALALDAAGNPHIAFYDPAQHELVYAHRDGGGWTEQTVETGVTVTLISIAVDGYGNPHMAYALQDLRLRYAVGQAPTSGVEPRKASEVSFGALHPNPSSGTASLSVALVEGTSVELQLYDVNGRLVASRPAEWLGTGRHVIGWRPELPTGGLYFLKARTTSGLVATRRWVVLR